MSRKEVIRYVIIRNFIMDTATNGALKDFRWMPGTLAALLCPWYLSPRYGRV